MISTRLEQYLDNSGVAYTRHVHSPAYTSQEIAHSVHVPGREMVKSVILKADEGPLVMVMGGGVQEFRPHWARKNMRR